MSKNETPEFIVFEDPDESGDALLLSPRNELDGLRYVAVQEAKHDTQWGVVLTADQQLAVAAELVGYDIAKYGMPVPEDEFRAQAAERAGRILTSFGGLASPRAIEVIGLAQWIAYGDAEIAMTIEALAYPDDEDDDDCYVSTNEVRNFHSTNLREQVGR